MYTTVRQPAQSWSRTFLSITLKSFQCSFITKFHVLPPVPGNHWSVPSSGSFASWKMSCRCHHTVLVICVWLLLLWVIFFRFVHVLHASTERSCSLLNSICYVDAPRFAYPHSPVSAHLGCFQFLAIMNEADRNFACTFNFYFYRF